MVTSAEAALSHLSIYYDVSRSERARTYCVLTAHLARLFEVFTLPQNTLIPGMV